MFSLLLSLLLTLSLAVHQVAHGAEFDETHSDMFVFLEKPQSLQEYGYSGFCPNTESFACFNPLPYKKHLGTRGYFESMDVVARSSGYEFREVMLESGKEYYFVAKPYKGNILGVANGDIAFVTDIESADDEVGQPLVEGSPVGILKATRSFGTTSYYVNDGEPLSEEKLHMVRNLLKSLNSRDFDEELVPILQVSAIDWDRIEQRYIIQIAPFYVDLDNGPVRAFIIKSRSGVNLFQRIQYDANDWLFVRRYVLLAGEHRYESPEREFKRDNTGGKIWEWYANSVDSQQRELMNAVAVEPDAIVRFYGSDYYADREMSPLQKNALKKMLRLYDLLKELSD